MIRAEVAINWHIEPHPGIGFALPVAEYTITARDEGGQPEQVIITTTEAKMTEIEADERLAVLWSETV